MQRSVRDDTAWDGARRLHGQRRRGRALALREPESRLAVSAAPQAVILVATDPPDPLVDVARRFATHGRVIGTGTYLDSLRFRAHLAQLFSMVLLPTERSAETLRKALAKYAPSG